MEIGKAPSGTVVVLESYGSGREFIGKAKIVEGVESPNLTFEKFFPTHQIGKYRGVSLMDFYNPFFSRHRYKSLAISASDSSTGSIENIYLTKISGARRKPVRRTPEVLVAEAEVILGQVLPSMESFWKAGGLNMDNFDLAKQELESYLSKFL